MTNLDVTNSLEDAEVWEVFGQRPLRLHLAHDGIIGCVPATMFAEMGNEMAGVAAVQRLCGLVNLLRPSELNIRLESVLHRRTIDGSLNTPIAPCSFEMVGEPETCAIDILASVPILWHADC